MHNKNRAESTSVFLSWSGKDALKIATALKTAIHSVLGNFDVFLSDVNITTGQAWLARLQSELNSCGFGIIILTPESVKSRWVLMEFGAIAKHFDSSVVIPIAIGMENDKLPEPFNIFQSVSFSRPDRLANRAAFYNLIESLMAFLCRQGVKQQMTLRRVEDAWQVFEKEVFGVVENMRPDIGGDGECEIFDAYDGAKFESAFHRCLLASRTLRAASIGLAMLYRSGRIQDLFEQRLMKRDIDVTLVYANPCLERPKFDPDPCWPGAQQLVPSFAGRWQEQKVHDKSLQAFLDRLMQKMSGCHAVEVEYQNGGRDSIAEAAAPLSFMLGQLLSTLEKLTKAEKEFEGESHLHKLSESVRIHINSVEKEIAETKSRLARHINLDVHFTLLHYFHSVVMFDDDMFVFWYGHDQVMHKEPVLHIRRSQSLLWQYFEDQYERYLAVSFKDASWNPRDARKWSDLQQILVNSNSRPAAN